MPFADPSPTQADLHFRLLGFPIRIHPFFWLVALLLSPDKSPLGVLLWAVVLLISIVVHELGHALLQRQFGGDPRIVLYGFGGLAIEQRVDRSAGQQILISLAGPFAGFLLAAVVLVGLQVAGNNPQWESIVANPSAWDPFESRPLNYMVWALLLVNIWWGLFNLLPIYPLDGGHVSRELACLVLRPDLGIIASLVLSLVCCAIAAAGLFYWTGSWWNTILLAAIGFSNYQVLEAYMNSRHGYR